MYPYLIGGDNDDGDNSQMSSSSNNKCKGVSIWIKTGLCLLILYLIITVAVLLWQRYKSNSTPTTAPTTVAPTTVAPTTPVPTTPVPTTVAPTPKEDIIMDEDL